MNLIQTVSWVLAVLMFSRGKGESGTATLYPDTFSENGAFASAANAIDGRTNIGESGQVTVENCASTRTKGKRSFQRLLTKLQYLQIDFQRPHSITAVRLHLRDGEWRRMCQEGLVVIVSNIAIQASETSVATQCGSPYGKTNFEQSPLFLCGTSGRYIYAVLRNSRFPLQVCEMQIFKAMDLTAVGVATSLPDNVYVNFEKKVLHGYSRDYGAAGVQNCVGLTYIPRQYLRVDLGHRQQIYSIRLDLREGTNNRHISIDDQKMAVLIGDSSQLSSPYPSHVCSLHSPQSSVFVCESIARYVWIIAKWNRNFSICEVEVSADIRCAIPTSPPNGNYITTRITHGGSLTVSCDEGFRPSSPSTVVCEMSGNWSRPLPKCQAFCDRPSNVVNGKLMGIGSNVKIDVGTSVLYTCNVGYTLSKQEYKRRTCLPNRKWSGTAPYCYEFSCSRCHKDADCVVATYCRCKQAFVGNGKFCCPKNIGEELITAGSTALFRCDRSCNVTFRHITWYKNGSPLTVSEPRYDLLSNGEILSLEKVTTDDAGEYMCEVHLGEALYQRYGNLEVIDSQSRNIASCFLDCGRSCSKKPKVDRGVLTYPGEFPWQAMLCYPSRGQYCGVVLVSSDCVVTAAHCIVRREINPQHITLCLGRQCGDCYGRDTNGKPQCSKRHSVVVHPHYDSLTLDNDIAVIKLRHSPSLDCTSVYPVCLPNKTRDGLYIRSNQQGIVAGWGRVNATVSKSKCLRKGHVHLASRRICAIRHSLHPITNSMMCATDYNGACRGDSGGPLVVQNRQYGDRYVLAGIVSWGTGCGKANKLGVYTSLLSHVDWVKNTCGIRA